MSEGIVFYPEMPLISKTSGCFSSIETKVAFLNMCSSCTFQVGEIVEVDEETTVILKNSQFPQDFLIRSIGEKLPTCGGCFRIKSLFGFPFPTLRQPFKKSLCLPRTAKARNKSLFF